MSRLSIYDENRCDAPLSVHTEHADISRELGAVGVRFEQWEASKPVFPGASQDEVIAAYRSDIDRLMNEKGYQAVDVISLTPDNPDRATVPITVTAACSLWTMNGINTSAGPSSICRCSSSMSNSA